MSNIGNDTSYRFDFGKYQGQSLEEIDLKEIDGYLAWMEKAPNKNKKLSRAIDAIKEYYQIPYVARELERLGL